MMDRKKYRRAALFSMMVVLMLTLTACAATKGSIVMIEKPFGGQFDIALNEWSAQNKCTMSLDKGEDLQVEIALESGDVSLTILGRNGSEPYMGKDLETCTFIVTVSETDDYEIQITGDEATGEIVLTNLSR